MKGEQVKKFSIILISMIFILSWGFAHAADVMIEKTVKQIVFKTDKNGNPYARVISTEKATINGITYDKDISLMAFGDIYKELKSIKKGQTLKAIAKEQTFRGATSYQILKVVK
jgi:hypothetical protein